MNPLQEGKSEAKSGLLTSSVTCEICGKVLSKKGHMDRHLRTVHQVELKIRKRGRPKGSTSSEAKKTLKDREVKGEDKVMRYRASRPRASRQSVPFIQSAQQMAWLPNSLIPKWYLPK